ncbi:hypothetical protein FA10DRAFT_183265 [Acaromyces ingoldii]|uniref:Uncharacterized protein n=1 Tax=Acaromyces ingoldii TaxID=215250 RepID=A0A316YDN6_9BASI|nr:hypothetical protein FA10DRAFT_183265 [Acaromyces ingoldii]PWN87339.1 hypothetical protein FA10DRAFT_183265 [Acaromyces ingoldii]
MQCNSATLERPRGKSATCREGRAAAREHPRLRWTDVERKLHVWSTCMQQHGLSTPFLPRAGETRSQIRPSITPGDLNPGFCSNSNEVWSLSKLKGAQGRVQQLLRHACTDHLAILGATTSKGKSTVASSAILCRFPFHSFLPPSSYPFPLQIYSFVKHHLPGPLLVTCPSVPSCRGA